MSPFLGLMAFAQNHSSQGQGRFPTHNLAIHPHEKMESLWKEHETEKSAGVEQDHDQEVDGGHGRIEIRRTWVLWDVQDLGELAQEWPGLKSLVLVERTREVIGVISCERHCYISSLGCKVKAKNMAEYVRGHWVVENNLRWQRDVSFKGDRRRIRKGHGAENFSRLCRIALNLLKREKTNKRGIDSKRKDAG
jgi:predicted transposase YbfD/YdcC